MVQRTFTDGHRLPFTEEGAELCRAVVEHNTDAGVTWLHSYVSEDKRTMFCIYDAPTPEAIRMTAGRNELPVDRITRVQVFDPYSYS
jgi:hypothetical protein